MIDQEETREAPGPPKKSVWPIVLLAIVLLAVGAGVLALLDDAPVIEPEPTATEAVAEEPLEPSADGSVDESPAEVDVDSPSFVPSDEPIADAAEIILPSVVQIQANGGVGSGVIFDSDGLILTAAHVVAGEDTVSIRLEDGEEIEGTVLGGDNGSDVAVIEVDRTGLPVAELALGIEPRVGQLAIAVGSPWGLQSTVTAGIISAVDQSINSGVGGFQAVLQTDAAINPGNSGGALVDRYGRVLGINVSIFSLSGANDGVGFAVPIDVAYDISQAVLAGESLESAFLGIVGSDVESGRAGALITEVTPGSAADAAGVQVDDLVVSLDGVAVQGIADLAAQVRSHRPGSEVEVVLIRDGEEMALEVTLGERPTDLNG